MSTISFQGRTALVTGATGGIGGELTAQLTSFGARVLATGRDGNRLAELGRVNKGVVTIVAELDTAEGRLRLVEEVSQLGGVDSLFNNAGVQNPVDARAPLDWAVIAQELETNLAAPIHLVHLLLGELLKNATAQRPALIVNITSGLALSPKASSAPYCATKAGLRSHTKSLRWQLRNEPVRVIEALPPLVRTAMTAGRNDDGMSPSDCATEILAGIRRNRDEIYVGKSKLLKVLQRVAPSVAAKKMLPS